MLDIEGEQERNRVPDGYENRPLLLWLRQRYWSLPWLARQCVFLVVMPVFLSGVMVGVLLDIGVDIVTGRDQG